MGRGGGYGAAVRTSLPLPPEDAARGAAVLARAFRDDPLMVHVQPDPARRERMLPHALAGIQDYCLRYGRVTTTPDVAGVACWLPPGATDVTNWRTVRSGLLTGSLRVGAGGLRRLLSLGSAMTRGHHRMMPTDHWYLWLLGTDPDQLGRGVAGAVLAPTLAGADAAGMPCYLDTHLERNLDFYHRHGFAPVLEEVADGLRFWGLRRDPR